MSQECQFGKLTKVIYLILNHQKHTFTTLIANTDSSWIPFMFIYMQLVLLDK